MFVFGVLAAVGTGLLGAWPYSPLVGWDTAAVIFSAWVWALIVSMTASETNTHATREDPGRAQADLIVIVAAVASLVAVGFVLVQASSASGASQDLLAGLGVVSVVVSWLAVHSLYALRYASLYYSGNPGGIDFNQTIPPRYLDFAYLAFTIGMTFQVSDTDLQTPTIRATALRQGLLAYLFGAIVLGTTINLIAGLASGG
ncbi:uncharacterized membrane protein [Jatrophihabitans sp. GAS493]|nr:uncharacterized membrane protein [Jatrophihabitans sp. GAS493]